jgi:D-alanyl-D-alanine carboxypeptidase (penicillin-binding protein 5/6)
MNELGKKLGMTNTNYVNCTGLPAAGGYSCAEDVARVYAYIMRSPFYGKFEKIWMYDLTHPSGRITGLTNTNRHSRFFSDCRGGKTGFTTEAGHCIAVTAERANMKPVAVIIGAGNSQTRFNESGALMNHVFDNYENKLIVNSLKPVGTTALRRAVATHTPVYAERSFYDLRKRGERDEPTINVQFAESVRAPIGASAPIGKIVITEDGTVLDEINVITRVNIDDISYFDSLKKVVRKFKI